jgi:hypothetical protein
MLANGHKSKVKETRSTQCGRLLFRLAVETQFYFGFRHNYSVLQPHDYSNMVALFPCANHIRQFMQMKCQISALGLHRIGVN